MGERKPRGPGSPEGFPGGLTQPCPQGRRPEKKECPKGRILVLGKHRSSVSREYRRGKTVNRDSQLREFPVYSAQKAQEAAGQAALNKGPRPRLTTGIAERIRDLILRERLSPYAAVMRLRACGDLPWVPCERSVYYALDDGLIGVARSQLPYRPAGKRRKRSGVRMAYTNARGRPITERPPGAEDRSEYGHWEADTVRIVRRFIPKGADISKFTRAQVQAIEDWINALPRKVLDGLSAAEMVKRHFEENVA